MSAPVAFDLVDHHGTAVTARTYSGRWLLVQFGFTSCRMVCPRALAKLDTALDAVGDAAVPLYVTVDPARDSRRRPDAADPDAADPDGYAVPHTAITHLVDPDGHRVAHWTDTVAADRIAADLLHRIAVST